MLKLKKLRMPLPSTINDCLLLWQMGYIVVIHDGKVEKVLKERGKKSGRIKNSERNRRAYQRA